MNSFLRDPLLLILTWTLLLLSSEQAVGNPKIDQIISYQSVPTFTQRHHALHKLSTSELIAGADQLIDFMQAQEVPEGMRPVDYMSLVNDSFNLLAKYNIRAEELLQLILSVIPDDSADEVWRDYAVQKLGYTLDRQDISGGLLQKGFGMLERAAKGEFPRVQGTALIVCFKLSDGFGVVHSFLEKDNLGRIALVCAQDPDSLLIDRVTALQIAGLCGLEDAFSYSKSILISSELHKDETMLLVSAIAVVGQLGHQNDSYLLHPHQLSPDIRIRSATRTALNKIQERL